MDTDKSAAAAAAGDGNPNPTATAAAAVAAADQAPPASPRRPSRTPFTTLSQVDADLALARALQEQEHAYMMLRMGGGGGGGEGSDYGSSDSGSWVEQGELEAVGEADGEIGENAVEVEGDEHEHDESDEGDDDEEEEGEGSDYGEDAFDAMEHGLNPEDFENDEAYARALHEAERDELAARLMALAGLNGWVAAGNGNQGGNNQDAWEDVDPDELSYEELIALGEVVGTQSRGLSDDTLASLPSITYKAQSAQDGNTDQCVICRLDYEDDESLVILSCKHIYHPECINQWLQINKVCPVCNTEVSAPASSS